MLPDLFRIGPLEFHAYGLMLAVSFVVGIQLALREGERRGLSTLHLANLALWILALSIAGSRLAYVVTHAGSFAGRWFDVIKLWEGGLTMYGGVVAALLGALVLVRRWRLPVAEVFDSFAPAIVLGEGITRIGCFLNGCCFGRPCSLPLAIEFPPHSHAGMEFPGQALHPTQLYLSAAAFLTFALLWGLRRRLAPPGRLFFLMLLAISVYRFAIDFLRYYRPDGEVVVVAGQPLSLTQALCVGLAAVAAIGLARRPPVAEETTG